MLKQHSKPDFPPVYSCRIPFVFGWTAALCDTGDFPKQTNSDLSCFPLANESICLVCTYNIMRDLCRQSLPLKWQLRRFSARRALIVCLTYGLTVNHVVVSDFNWMHRRNQAIKNKSLENKLNKQTIWPHYKLVIPLVCPCLPQNATALATASYSGYSNSRAPSGENQVTHSPSTHKHNSFPGLMTTFLQCGHLGSSLHPRPLYTRPYLATVLALCAHL